MNKKEILEIPLSDLVGDSSLPDPVTYQYYKNLKNRKIIINEEIGDSLLETATLPFIEMDNDGTNMPIEVIISTVGGEIYSGFNFVDQIEKAKSPVIIHIMAMAASMGFLIAMAGKNNPNVKNSMSSV